MPDEADRFSGLGDSLQEGDDDSTEAETHDERDATATGETAATTTSSMNAHPETEEPAPEASDDDGEEYPEPFGFAETSQQSYYVRDDTFGPISANRSRVRAVASKHGLDEDELSKRELHDAELSVLQSMDDWDIAVALEVLERRGVDVDEETVRSVYDVLR